MRALALLLPLSLLVAIWFVAGRRGAAPPAPAPIVVVEADVHGSGFVWVSHDWIEEIPNSAGATARLRRETFGMDAVTNSDGQCADANCRACLIDLVYGREF